MRQIQPIEAKNRKKELNVFVTRLSSWNCSCAINQRILCIDSADQHETLRQRQQWRLVEHSPSALSPSLLFPACQQQQCLYLAVSMTGPGRQTYSSRILQTNGRASEQRRVEVAASYPAASSNTGSATVPTVNGSLVLRCVPNLDRRHSIKLLLPLSAATVHHLFGHEDIRVAVDGYWLDRRSFHGGSSAGVHDHDTTNTVFSSTTTATSRIATTAVDVHQSAPADNHPFACVFYVCTSCSYQKAIIVVYVLPVSPWCESFYGVDWQNFKRIESYLYLASIISSSTKANFVIELLSGVTARWIVIEPQSGPPSVRISRYRQQKTRTDRDNSYKPSRPPLE